MMMNPAAVPRTGGRRMQASVNRKLNSIKKADPLQRLESAKEHSRKFKGPDPDPLEQEAKLKELQPMTKWQRDQLIRMATAYAESAAGNPAKVTAAGMVISHVLKEQFDGDIQQAFLKRFWKWLLGRPDQDDVRRTPWGRQPLYDDPEVREYIDLFVTRREEFKVKLELLKRKVPTGIAQSYLYFKYIVAGEELADISYLADWDVFLQAFDEAGVAGQAPFDPAHPWWPRPYAAYGDAGGGGGGGPPDGGGLPGSGDSSDDALTQRARDAATAGEIQDALRKFLDTYGAAESARDEREKAAADEREEQRRDDRRIRQQRDERRQERDAEKTRRREEEKEEKRAHDAKKEERRRQRLLKVPVATGRPPPPTTSPVPFPRPPEAPVEPGTPVTAEHFMQTMDGHTNAVVQALAGLTREAAPRAPDHEDPTPALVAISEKFDRHREELAAQAARHDEKFDVFIGHFKDFMARGPDKVGHENRRPEQVIASHASELAQGPSAQAPNVVLENLTKQITELGERGPSEENFAELNEQLKALQSDKKLNERTVQLLARVGELFGPEGDVVAAFKDITDRMSTLEQRAPVTAAAHLPEADSIATKEQMSQVIQLMQKHVENRLQAAEQEKSKIPAAVFSMDDALRVAETVASKVVEKIKSTGSPDVTTALSHVWEAITKGNAEQLEATRADRGDARQWADLHAAELKSALREEMAQGNKVAQDQMAELIAATRGGSTGDVTGALTRLQGEIASGNTRAQDQMTALIEATRGGDATAALAALRGEIVSGNKGAKKQMGALVRGGADVMGALKNLHEKIATGDINAAAQMVALLEATKKGHEGSTSGIVGAIEKQAHAHATAHTAFEGQLKALRRQNEVSTGHLRNDLLEVTRALKAHDTAGVDMALARISVGLERHAASISQLSEAGRTTELRTQKLIDVSQGYTVDQRQLAADMHISLGKLREMVGEIAAQKATFSNMPFTPTGADETAGLDYLMKEMADRAKTYGGSPQLDQLVAQWTAMDPERRVREAKGYRRLAMFTYNGVMQDYERRNAQQDGGVLPSKFAHDMLNVLKDFHDDLPDAPPDRPPATAPPIQEVIFDLLPPPKLAKTKRALADVEQEEARAETLPGVMEGAFEGDDEVDAAQALEDAQRLKEEQEETARSKRTRKTKPPAKETLTARRPLDVKRTLADVEEEEEEEEARAETLPGVMEVEGDEKTEAAYAQRLKEEQEESARSKRTRKTKPSVKDTARHLLDAIEARAPIRSKAFATDALITEKAGEVAKDVAFYLTRLQQPARQTSKAESDDWLKSVQASVIEREPGVLLPTREKAERRVARDIVESAPADLALKQAGVASLLRKARKMMGKNTELAARRRIATKFVHEEFSGMTPAQRRYLSLMLVGIEI